MVYSSELAADLLQHLGNRWVHTVGVASRVDDLAVRLAPDEPAYDHLVASAWLHDIGYSDRIARTGFHPVDGADFLVAEGWPAQVVTLVAHHSGARFVADVLRRSEDLRRYPYRESVLMDLLTYADQTIGPTGLQVTVAARMSEMLRRHGPDSPNMRAHPRRAPYLLAVERRVQERLWERTLLPAMVPAAATG